MSMRILGKAVLLSCLAGCAATDGTRESSAAGSTEGGAEASPERLVADRGTSSETSAEDLRDGEVVEASGIRRPTGMGTTGDQAVRQETAPQDRPARARRFAEALEIWNSPDYRRKLALSLISTSDIEPTVTADEQELLLEVFELLAEEDEARAEKSAREALRILRSELDDSSSAVLYFWVGVIHLQFEELDPARASFEAAVRKSPSFRRAWARLGQMQFRDQEFAKARESFQQVIEKGGADGSLYGLLGACHAALGDYLAAESAFRLAILMEPETIDWKYGLAESFGFQGKFADAVALFGQLLEGDPDNVDFWMAQGQAYARMKEPLRAAENFEMVDQLGGSTASSLTNLGALYSNSGLYELAVDAYRRALRLDPSMNVGPLVLAANFLAGNAANREAGDLIAAIQEFAAEGLADDQRKDLLRLQSRLAAARGDNDVKISVLEEIIALDPRDGDALILLGDHYYRQGDADQAEFYFKQAEEIPEFERSAKLGRAQVLARQQRYAEALPLLERAQVIQSTQNVQDFLEQIEAAARGR